MDANTYSKLELPTKISLVSFDEDKNPKLKNRGNKKRSNKVNIVQPILGLNPSTKEL